MNLKDLVPQPNKQWLTVVLVALLILVGGIGTCTKYIGPLLGPTPSPQPGPLPNPIPQPGPNAVWQPLEMPAKNVVPGLELPAPTQISASRKYIIVAAKCGSRVRWLVTAKSGSTVDALESPLTNSILIFTTGKPNDVLMVLAYSVVNNVATDPAVTFIAVTGDTPPPNPDPAPGPDPAPEPGTKPSKLHVTFLLDFNKQTRAISDVINDSGLRKWLNDNGHKVHEVSIRDAHTYNLDTYIEGKAPPLLILQTQGVDGFKEGTLVHDVGVTQLYSVQGVKDAIIKATGKKE